MWRPRALLLAHLASASAQAAGEQALVRGPSQALAADRSLAPGQIVGQGRYVLAEKLCDVVRRPGTWRHGHQSLLPAPGERLLIGGPSALGGQLVPYEGLAQAIAKELPQLPLPESSALRFLPGVHDYSVSYLRRDPLYEEDTWNYRFGQRLGKGAFGEAWRAVTLDGSMREVVLKRLFVEQGEHVRLSGEREIYFGTMLQNKPHVTRFLGSFERHDHDLAELWLVFQNEGFSLTHHIFQLKPGSSVVGLSEFWWHLKRQQPLGSLVIKNFAYQMLHGLAVAHELNITHRDIKLSNVLVTDTWPPVVRLCDWGSALISPPNEEMHKLYRPDGPGEEDETDGYRPPEAMFDLALLEESGITKAGVWRDKAYDMWSLGVLLLELVLGMNGVFQVNQRRWLRVEHELKQLHVPAERLEEGRQLQALLDLCIAPPGAQGATLSQLLVRGRRGAPALPQCGGPSEPSRCAQPYCTDDEFADVLRRRDAAGAGLPDVEGRDLLRQLLQWSPEVRISARDALAHPWFDDGAPIPDVRGHVSVQPISPAPEETDWMQEDEEGEEDNIGAPGECSETSECANNVDQKITSQPDHPVEVVYVAEAASSRSCSLASSCQELRLHAAAYSDIGARRQQEDRFTLQNLSASGVAGTRFPAAAFLAVYDGHGGNSVAERLRLKLHEMVDVGAPVSGNMSEALLGAFAAFDRELPNSCSGHNGAASDKSRREGVGRVDPGSTALVVVVSGCQLHVANLGDCRAVLAQDGEPSVETHWPLGARVEVRESPSAELKGQLGIIVEIRNAAKGLYIVRLLRDGELRPFRQRTLRLLSKLNAVRLTEDHKPGSERERRRIEALGGQVEEPQFAGGAWRVAGLATSRSFGRCVAKPFVTPVPDISAHTPRKGRDVFLVIASDGVWDVMEDQLVIDLVWDRLGSAHDSRRELAVLEDAAQLVVQTAKERGSLDNLSCVVLLLAWAG